MQQPLSILTGAVKRGILFLVEFSGNVAGKLQSWEGFRISSPGMSLVASRSSVGMLMEHLRCCGSYKTG